MTYRDADDALRYRVEELEAELADARRTIARLEGKEREGAVTEGVDWLTGAPERLVLERVLDRELTDPALEALVNLARQRLPDARVVALEKSVSIQAHAATIRIERADSGGTRVRLDRNPKHVRGGLGALVMLGSVFLNFPLAMYTSALLPTPLWLASIAVLFVANVVGARALVSRGQHRMRRNVLGVFEAAVDLVNELGGPLQKTRVSSAQDTPEPELDEASSLEQQRLRVD